MSSVIFFCCVVSLILTLLASKQIGFRKRYVGYYNDLFKKMH